MHPSESGSWSQSSVTNNAPTTTPLVLYDSSTITLASSSIVFQIVTIATSVTPTFLSTPPTSTAGSLANLTSMPTSMGSPTDGRENTGECELLGPFAIIVQAALGGLALLSLVYKRWRERPQRPIKIWAFDASKQVVGSILLHLANLVMSMFSAGEIQASLVSAATSVVGVNADGEKYQPNPCSFYLLNLGIDTTLGIPILIIVLRVLTAGANLTGLANPPESIQSGHYGQPPKASWWLKQSLIYFFGLMIMKLCVFVIFQLCPWIIVVGDWALRWTEGNEAIQIAFVMLIFPLIMNALQYYIIDGFIKNNKVVPEGEDEEADEQNGEHGRLLAGDGLEEGPDVADGEEILKDNVNISTTTKSRPRRVSSYNPEVDGEDSTPTAGSSSAASNHEEGTVEGTGAH